MERALSSGRHAAPLREQHKKGSAEHGHVNDVTGSLEHGRAVGGVDPSPLRLSGGGY